MMNKKTTKREHFEQVLVILSLAEDQDFELDGINYDELNEFIKGEIENLDKKAAKAKERAASKKAEGDELRDRIAACLNSDGFTTIPEILETLNDDDVTAQKVTARLTQLVKLGTIEKDEVTIPASGEGGKSRKLTGYRVIG